MLSGSYVQTGHQMDRFPNISRAYSRVKIETPIKSVIVIAAGEETGACHVLFGLHIYTNGIFLVNDFNQILPSSSDLSETIFITGLEGGASN